MIATSFLPLKWAIAIMLSVFLVMMIVPVVYSYSIYRGHQKQGISYSYVPKSKAEKIAVKTSAIFVPLILIGVLILEFVILVLALPSSPLVILKMMNLETTPCMPIPNAIPQ